MGRECSVGETAAMSRTARADTRLAGGRRRAVGTRDRIIAHLALVAEVADGTGMASTRLAEAVGYPGSSVAFAQLLAQGAPGRGAEPPLRAEDGGLPAYPGTVDFDELADRVIIRLVRRLAELSPAELAVLERLLVPADKGSLKIV